MLEAARHRLDGLEVDLRVAELTGPLPAGPFDLVVSALAIHHLEAPDKAHAVRPHAGALRPGGRFVLGDVVIPVDPADAVTPLTGGHDRPSTAGRPAALAGRGGPRRECRVVGERPRRAAGRPSGLNPHPPQRDRWRARPLSWRAP